MAGRFSRGMYKIIKALVKFFYPMTEMVGTENLPDGACVIVGNHTQMNGPIVSELYVPGDREIWCAAEMMTLKEVPAYAFKDFWSIKPPYIRWFFRILSYLIAPLAVCIFNNARCIAVYHDMRIRHTFSRTITRLKEGAHIVIFPEQDPQVNDILYSFRDRFIDLGKLYGRQTGKSLSFVPMYIAPDLRKAVFGKPVVYDINADPKEERERICKAMFDSIVGIAYSLPRHKVIQYRKIPGRPYPYNDRPTEEK